MPKIYQYAAIWTPTEKQIEDGNGTAVKPLIIVPVTPVLASSDQEATLVAARAIPESYVDQLDQIQLVVQGF